MESGRNLLTRPAPDDQLEHLPLALAEPLKRVLLVVAQHIDEDDDIARLAARNAP